MIELDGATGEGGGQILRSALTLSTLTSQPFRIKNIRRHRPKPGLQPQHLQCVQAAGAICRAHLDGNKLNSTQLIFEPGAVLPGEYRFDIGTAGATALVLQTIFLPLSFASTSSHVIITGGTHVPWSPCYDYLELQWLPFMKRLGFDAELQLVQAGFYPKGGGKIVAKIHPAETLSSLQITNRGKLKTIQGISAYANLNRQVAERQVNQARLVLRDHEMEAAIRIKEWPSPGINTMMLLMAVFEHSLSCHFALGARGKPAEKVATESAESLLNFLSSSGVFDEYLADQLLLPLAIAKGDSVFKTPQITQHLLTNIEVIRAFMNTEIAVEGNLGEEGVVRLRGVNLKPGR